MYFLTFVHRLVGYFCVAVKQLFKLYPLLWSCAGFRDQSHCLLIFATNWLAYSGEIPLRLKKKDKVLRRDGVCSDCRSGLAAVRGQPAAVEKLPWVFELAGALSLPGENTRPGRDDFRMSNYRDRENRHFQAIKLTNHLYFNVNVLQHSCKWVIIKVEGNGFVVITV